MVLAKAINAALFELREETHTPWILLGTLRARRYQGGSLQIRNLEDAGLMMGIFLDTREGWLEFARRVAQHLPETPPEELIP
jgi:hypothetical protein